MKIDDLLRAEDAGWTEIHRLIDPLSPTEAETPGYFPEGWSVKDLLGHLGSWLAEAGVALERIRVGTYRPGELDIDAKNEAFLEALRPLTLRETHAQAEAARAQTLRALRSLPEVSDGSQPVEHGPRRRRPLMPAGAFALEAPQHRVRVIEVPIRRV